jgi:CRISPR/Cas system-associated exonuclease Cas4 (RecB family)
MKIIRASEIGTYLFCQRAWWYQLKGYEPENNTELAGGLEIHARHSRRVMVNNCLQAVAYGVLLAAIITAVIWVIQTGL